MILKILNYINNFKLYNLGHYPLPLFFPFFLELALTHLAFLHIFLEGVEGGGDMLHIFSYLGHREGEWDIWHPVNFSSFTICEKNR